MLSSVNDDITILQGADDHSNHSKCQLILAFEDKAQVFDLCIQDAYRWVGSWVSKGALCVFQEYGYNKVMEPTTRFKWSSDTGIKLVYATKSSITVGSEVFRLTLGLRPNFLLIDLVDAEVVPGT